MAVLFDYMSWNIEKLSENHAERDMLMGDKVGLWIGKLVLDMRANVMAVMEVTLGTGELACQLVTSALNTLAGAPAWQVVVSTDSAPSSKADRYGLFWAQTPFNYGGNSFTGAAVSNVAVNPGTAISWDNRRPLTWVTTSGGTAVNCAVWHAPQPKDHKRATTIQTLADLTAQIEGNTGNARFVVSGDFNYETSDASVYQPLTAAGFVGAFDGELTTMRRLKTFIATNAPSIYQPGQYDDEYLSSAYDNIFLKTVTGTDKMRVLVPDLIAEEIANGGFSPAQASVAAEALVQARRVSDHLPLVVTVQG